MPVDRSGRQKELPFQVGTVEAEKGAHPSDLPALPIRPGRSIHYQRQYLPTHRLQPPEQVCRSVSEPRATGLHLQSMVGEARLLPLSVRQARLTGSRPLQKLLDRMAGVKLLRPRNVKHAKSQRPQRRCPTARIDSVVTTANFEKLRARQTFPRSASVSAEGSSLRPHA